MKRIRLRTILLAVNLFVLAGPLAGTYAFHIYENQLIRQVESELIAQGAYASAFYKAGIRQEPALPCWSTTIAADPDNIDVEPVLDLDHDRILPPRPDAIASAAPADAVALHAALGVYPILAEAAHITLAGFRIVDCHGIVVAGRSEVGDALAGVPEVKAALDGHYAAVLRKRTTDNPHPPLASISRGANIRVFVAMPITMDGKVIGAILLSRTPRNIAESLYDERHAVLAAAAIVVALTLLLALLTSRAISQPITALRRQAHRIGQGDSDVPPLAHPVTVEIGQLSETLVAMGQTIQQRTTYIRDFAAHVSHEFKTPLTAIQGSLELVQEHRGSMKPDQLERFLSNAIKDTERLKILVARLLELARADMTQSRAGSCELSSVLAPLQVQFPSLAIVIDGDERALPVPEDVVRAVLATLFTNSVQHGATKVTVSIEHGMQAVSLSIADNGSSITPANAAKLFTPFFTTKREQGGTGLGLVIVRSMLNAYRATIAHQHSATGTAFALTLPGVSDE